MAVTTNIALTGGQYTLIATGPVVATVTLHSDSPAEWVVTESASVPTTPYGHALSSRTNLSVQLAASERLHLRGTGVIALTSEAI